MAKLNCPKCSRAILQCTSSLGKDEVVFLCGCGYRLIKSYEQIKIEDRRILELQLNKMRNCPDELVDAVMKLIDVKVTYHFGEVWTYTMSI